MLATYPPQDLAVSSMYSTTASLNCSLCLGLPKSSRAYVASQSTVILLWLGIHGSSPNSTSPGTPASSSQSTIWSKVSPRTWAFTVEPPSAESEPEIPVSFANTADCNGPMARSAPSFGFGGSRAFSRDACGSSSSSSSRSRSRSGSSSSSSSSDYHPPLVTS